MHNTIQMTANWAEWTGASFTKEADSAVLEGRETPKLYLVTLPSGAIERLKKFDRVGRCNTNWRRYYGSKTRKYIDLTLLVQA